MRQRLQRNYKGLNAVCIYRSFWAQQIREKSQDCAVKNQPKQKCNDLISTEGGKSRLERDLRFTTLPDICEYSVATSLGLIRYIFGPYNGNA